MNIVIFIDGVLRGGFGQPLRTGTHFLGPQFEEHRVLLIGRDREHDRRWLEEEHLTDYAALAELHPLDVEQGILWRTMGELRSRGPIDLVITGDPSHAREVYSLGYEVFLYLSPAFTKPSWRPDARKDSGPTPWQAFMEEVGNQRRAKAAIAAVPDE